MNRTSSHLLADALDQLADGLSTSLRTVASAVRALNHHEGDPAKPMSPPSSVRTLPAARPKRQLMTVKQFAETQPTFTEASIRWLIFNAQWNRFDEVIVRLGKRVLIDTEKFEKWLKLPAGERESGPRRQ